MARDIASAQKAATDAVAPGGTEGAERAVQLGLITPIDLNALLPRLITTAAGLSIALVLLGMIMLLGASAVAQQPENSASPSPASSGEQTGEPTAS